MAEINKSGTVTITVTLTKEFIAGAQSILVTGGAYSTLPDPTPYPNISFSSSIEQAFQ